VGRTPISANLIIHGVVEGNNAQITRMRPDQ
jgi:hypothetical protein